MNCVMLKGWIEELSENYYFLYYVMKQAYNISLTYVLI